MPVYHRLDPNPNFSLAGSAKVQRIGGHMLERPLSFFR